MIAVITFAEGERVMARQSIHSLQPELEGVFVVVVVAAAAAVVVVVRASLIILRFSSRNEIAHLFEISLAILACVNDFRRGFVDPLRLLTRLSKLSRAIARHDRPPSRPPASSPRIVVALIAVLDD